VSYLLWSDVDFSVQIPAIDNEHKLLVTLINEFNLALQLDESFHSQIITEILEKLFRCITSHFESEERLLTINNYPDLAAHKFEHTLLVKQLRKFESQFKTEKKAFNEKMLLYFKDWLIRHVVIHDQKFGRYFFGKKLIG